MLPIVPIVYTDSVRHCLWGTNDESAALAFFLDEAEQLVRVRVYKIGSMAHNLQVSSLLALFSNDNNILTKSYSFSPASIGQATPSHNYRPH